MLRIFDFGGREVERSQTIAGEKGKPAKGANPQALEPILPVSRGSAARDSSPSASSDAGAPAALHVSSPSAISTQKSMNARTLA